MKGSGVHRVGSKKSSSFRDDFPNTRATDTVREAALLLSELANRLPLKTPNTH